MRYELKSISIWALIKVSFFFNLIVGFIAGLLYGLLFSFIMAIMAKMPFGRSELPDLEMPMGLMIVILPFICAIGSAIFHTLILIVVAFIYNMIAKLTGGMEFELSPVTVAPVPPPPAQPITGYTSAPPPPSTQLPPSPPPAQPMSPPPPGENPPSSPEP